VDLLVANAFSVPRPQLRVWVTFYNYYLVAEPNKNIKNGTNIKAFYSIAKLRRSEADALTADLLVELSCMERIADWGVK